MRLFICFAIFLFQGTVVFGGSVGNGTLAVDVDNGNGAITSVKLSETEFFREGTYVSNFGLQIGTDTSTFTTNNAYGFSGLNVTVSPTNLVTGTYFGIDFTRSYSLVSGLNVLRITNTFMNTGRETVLSYFDTFDPDQEVSLSTFDTLNDVFTLGGGKVGQAEGFNAGMTFVLGSLDARATVASGGPFGIFEGSYLNDFFSAPVDGEGSYSDNGTHIGLRTLLGAGQSTSFVVDLAFGRSALDAQNQFLLANTMAAVPEPTSVAILGIGSIGMVIGRRLRKKASARTMC